jgi:hypothetical protein
MQHDPASADAPCAIRDTVDRAERFLASVAADPSALSRPIPPELRMPGLMSAEDLTARYLAFTAERNQTIVAAAQLAADDDGSAPQ